MSTFRSAIIWISSVLVIGICALLLIASQLSNSIQQNFVSNASIGILALESQFSDDNDTFSEYGDQYFTELGAIEQFKMKTKNLVLPQEYMAQNTYIIRWIMDQEGNIDKAVEKFEQSLQWRKENNVEEVINEEFSDLLAYWPIKFEGFDKKGNPIAILQFGSWQISKLIVAGKLDRLYRMEYFKLENETRFIQELSHQAGKVVKAFTIVDFAGFSYRTHSCYKCVPLMLNLAKLYESYYPEFTEKALLINVPRIAHTFLNLILPFLSQRTRDLMELFGYDKEEWSTALLKYVDEDQLPARYRKNHYQQTTESTSWWW